MRKIGSQQNADEKKKKNSMILGILLVILMIFSTVGYAFLSFDGGSSNAYGSESITYNGFEFVGSFGSWNLNLGGNNFYFSYLPDDVASVQINGDKSLGEYVGKPLYLVSETEEYGNVVRNLAGYFERVQDACLGGTTCEDDLPVLNCDEGKNMIIFDASSVNDEVFIESSCVYLNGDIARASDAFMYRILGVL